jgi:hypothetical protein
MDEMGGGTRILQAGKMKSQETIIALKSIKAPQEWREGVW